MIEVIAGLPGSGKTLRLVDIAEREMRKGRRVLSMTPIKGTYKLTPDDLNEAEFEPGDCILIDEAGAFFPSHAWDKVPPGTFVLFSQGRHMKLDLYVAVQSPIRLAKPLRELANYYWFAESYFWGLFTKYTAYLDFEHYGRLDNGESYVKGTYYLWIWRKRKLYKLYDTHDKSLIGERKRKKWELWHVEIPKERRPTIKERIKAAIQRVLRRSQDREAPRGIPQREEAGD